MWSKNPEENVFCPMEGHSANEEEIKNAVDQEGPPFN